MEFKPDVPAPEVHTPPDHPEVHQEQAGLEYYPSPYQLQMHNYNGHPGFSPTISLTSPPVQSTSPIKATSPTSLAPGELAQEPAADNHPGKPPFFLWAIIGVLFAAVIGLSASTGVMTKRANDAETKLANASPPEDSNSLGSGLCMSNTSADGTDYTPLFWNSPSYRIYCNQDTTTESIMSIFTNSLDECLDACAAWSSKVPEIFNVTDLASSASKNATCSGASFVPAWTDRNKAQDATSWGNCFMKPKPSGKLKPVPIGGDAAHVGVLETLGA